MFLAAHDGEVQCDERMEGKVLKYCMESGIKSLSLNIAVVRDYVCIHL